MIDLQPTGNGRGHRGLGPGLCSMRSRCLGALLIVAALTLGPVGSAQAQAQVRSISRSEAAALARDASAALARDASTDPSALRRLQTITEIDGHPVDLRSALAGSAAEQAARLDALASELGTPAGSPTAGADRGADAARASAQEILGNKKFNEQQLPKPFKGLLEWMADRFRPIGAAISDFFGGVVGAILALPGGPFILTVVVTAILVAITRWLINRRSRAYTSDAANGYLVDLGADPAELEQQAEAAQSEGDHSAAVRLRYEAGLLRLSRADQIVLRADTTAAGAARQIDRPVMDDLTGDFEEVVYGERVATAVDSDRARSGWNDLLGVRNRR